MLHNKTLSGVLLILCVLFALALPAAAEDVPDGAALISAEEETGFRYIHDPCLNPSAMADIIVDPTAVYGFRPNPESTRLGVYADYDWSDPEFVMTYRQERIDYHESMKELYVLEEQLVGEGADIETVARAVSALRNELRLRSYDGNPEGLEAVKASNLAAYGNENGPTADSLYEKYGSWETVLEKAFSANSGLDACFGLYDDYYGLYCMVGQVDDPDYLYDQQLLVVLKDLLDDLAILEENPTLTCTRAQTAALLWTLSDCPQPVSDTAAFSDVPRGSRYYLPIQWAKEAGITCGTSETTFSPDAVLTRAQIVTLLMRASAPAYVPQTENVFTDVAEDAYYRNAVLWAWENGITLGTSETTFSPDAECSFEETAVFFDRWIEYTAASAAVPEIADEAA